MQRSRHHQGAAARGPRSGRTVASRGAILAVVAALIATAALAGPASAQTRPWEESPPATSHPDVDVTRDVVYGTASTDTGATVDLTLDVYRAHDLVGVRRPAVVWIHGGGFVMGDKADAADAQAATLLAQRGFVAVSVNYRLSSTFAFFGPGMVPAATEAKADVQSALRWIRANSRSLDVDPTHIGVAGASAGGLTALHVGYAEHAEMAVSAQSVVSLSGAGLLPIATWAGSPSALMVNGTSDTLVPIDAARATCTQLDEGRDRCESMEVPAGHSLNGYEATVTQATIDHLVRTLQPDPAIAFGTWLRDLRRGSSWR